MGVKIAHIRLSLLLWLVIELWTIGMYAPNMLYFKKNLLFSAQPPEVKCYIQMSVFKDFLI